MSTISFKASFSVRRLTTRRHHAGLARLCNDSRSDPSRYAHYTDTVFTPLMLIARPAVHAHCLLALDLPPPRRLPRHPTPPYTHYKGICAMNFTLLLIFFYSFALPRIRPTARTRTKQSWTCFRYARAPHLISPLAIMLFIRQNAELSFQAQRKPIHLYSPKFAFSNRRN